MAKSSSATAVKREWKTSQHVKRGGHLCCLAPGTNSVHADDILMTVPAAAVKKVERIEAPATLKWGTLGLHENLSTGFARRILYLSLV